MGRVAKKPAGEQESTTPTVTQTRTRRTPKPNPKYAGDSVMGSKLDAIDAPINSDSEEKPPVDVKKSVKKGSDSAGKAAKVSPALKKIPAVKKQKLDLDDDEDSKEKSDEVKVTARATRSGRNEETLKIGEESVAIIDVASIMSHKPATPSAAAEPIESNRSLRRKRGGAEDSQPEEAAKKKKDSEDDERDRPSAITTRKSYLPLNSKKLETEVKTEVKVEVKSPIPAGVKVTRNNSGSDSSLKKEPIELKSEVKKLPFVKKVESQPVRVVQSKSPVKSPVAVQAKVINPSPTAGRPLPRILNSLVSTRGKQSPQIKLTGGSDKDKKVFSIDLTDDSIKERKQGSPVKPSPVVRVATMKENVVTPKPRPADMLTKKLESEYNRMRASASMMVKRNSIGTTHPIISPAANAARRITKFESWYVIDMKQTESVPFRHSHTHSLISLGNNISELKMPSNNWEYKMSLQRRTIAPKVGDEVFTGDVHDKNIETDKQNYEPVNILFKRNHKIGTKISIDRSLMIKQNLYTITMNGKQCKLVGAPGDIKSLEDLEILLEIIDSTDLNNKCIELVTHDDMVK